VRCQFQSRCTGSGTEHGATVNFVIFFGAVPNDESASARAESASPIPLSEVCPACGAPVEGQKCKVYCPNERCVLYRRIIENCAGD
jgi:hypothetical protein